MSDLMKVGERRFKGFLLSRVLVIVGLVVIPILMFLLFSGLMGDIFLMNWIPVEFRSYILMITPWLYSISWIFMIILFANRISASIDAMDKNFSVIPNRLSIFYGVNALVVMLVFAFPLLTPIIAVLSFASFGYRLATIGKDLDEEEKTPKFAIVLGLIFAIIPAIVSIAVIPDMLAFSEYLWKIWTGEQEIFNYQINFIENLYNISMALCTALTYGSLIILFKTGVAEYEQIKNIPGEKKPTFLWVKALVGFLFALFLFLQWREVEFLKVFFYGGFIIVIFVTLVNFIRGRGLSKDFQSFSVGYILTAVLLGANVISWAPGLTETVKNLTIIISAATYLILYALIFIKIDID